MNRAAFILLTVGAALFVGLLAWQGFGAVTTTLMSAGWGLAIVAAFHLIPLALDAGAIAVLLDRKTRHGSFCSALKARWTGEAHAQRQNRSGYVKSLREGAWYAAGQKYNVMIIRWNNKFESHFNGAIYDQKVSADGFPAFRVVVFKDGWLVNHGDGGYDNWAFRGSYYRNGGSLTFYRF